MREKRESNGAAENRRLKLAMEIFGGVATLATVGVVIGLAVRRKRLEDNVNKFTDQIAILESDELAQRGAILRRLAAASLGQPEGATPGELKRIVGAKVKDAPGEALTQLVHTGILHRVKNDDNSVDLLRPSTQLIDAVITWPEEAPRLRELAQQYQPNFSLEQLLPYTSDPKVARVGDFSDDNS